MEKLKLKYESLCLAINSLNSAIEHLEKVKNLSDKNKLQYFEYDNLYTAARDSLIQRFEFSVELFWKYLKFYLTEIKKVKPVSNTPMDIIREGCKANLITENDSENFIDMLKSRNLSSHIYKEETADIISRDIIFNFYKILNFYTGKLKP
ncbi:MAG: HI0074 family nucleotidyltransferase substrate-binding subunit [bacterium]